MKALVTGGGGFLGRRIVELLLERGDEVHFLARGSYSEVEALGAVGHQVDIRDADALPAVLEGVDTVLHVAALVAATGRREDFQAVNVGGTRNVIQAARGAGVARFVYTSTPSVVSYDAPIVNGGQDLPYATKFTALYPESKAEAERLVLRANSERMATVAIRPHLVFGPGDNNLLPRFVNAALRGRLRIIGDGENEVDFTYVDNAAWAHLDAADALTSHEAACAGKAYFLSNGEPVKLWPWFNGVLAELGLPPITRRMSHGLARNLFGLIELAYKVLPGEPTVTRFLADAMATSHWFDMGPAERDFGYRPRVSMAEALPPTVDFLRQTVVEPATGANA